MATQEVFLGTDDTGPVHGRYYVRENELIYRVGCRAEYAVEPYVELAWLEECQHLPEGEHGREQRQLVIERIREAFGLPLIEGQATVTSRRAPERRSAALV